ncbi:MAG: aldo/keto reductase, partial [Clostridiales bacterium]|nr:aldo/keto reductase [Clostridiales bacterium]
MDYKSIGGIQSSSLVLGCMRIANKLLDENERLVRLALDMGINTFDHADIYGGGACEEIYGKIISKNKGLRDKMVLQTKCGIRGGWYDLSFDHISESVNGSLKRLNTDYIDILLLHRP